MNQSVRNALLSSLIALLLSQGASSATPENPQQPLDEVTIKSKRFQLDETRREFNKVQDRLFARYNELNHKREFEMNCRDVMKTGTRIGGKRECTAVFEDDANQLEAQMAFEHLQPIQEQRTSAMPVQNLVEPPKQAIEFNGTPAPASMAIDARRPEFREHWKKLASSDPELIRLLRERSELKERHETLRREIFGLPSLPVNTDAAAAASR
jgi:uncharacterized protein YdcH (DUF465 family)